jgi:hypothetical protein
MNNYDTSDDVDDLFTAIISILSTSLQMRSGVTQTANLPRFNADSSILLCLPSMLRELESLGHDVSQSASAADYTIHQALFCWPQSSEPALITAADVEVSYAVMLATGLVAGDDEAAAAATDD